MLKEYTPLKIGINSIKETAICNIKYANSWDGQKLASGVARIIIYHPIKKTTTGMIAILNEIIFFDDFETSERLLFKFYFAISTSLIKNNNSF